MYPMDRNEKTPAVNPSLLLLRRSSCTILSRFVFIISQENFRHSIQHFCMSSGALCSPNEVGKELIGTDTFLGLRELELLIQIEQSNFHIERCIYINGKQFDFMIEEFVSDGAVHFLWKFGRASNSIKRITRSLPLHADVVNFMRAVKRLDKSEYDFFGFYAGGASHKIMGQFLGLENGSSRNKSSQILTKLNISSRDDAFIVLHLSELLEPVMKNVRDIITRHVNRLL